MHLYSQPSLFAPNTPSHNCALFLRLCVRVCVWVGGCVRARVYVCISWLKLPTVSPPSLYYLNTLLALHTV
jgi:hypothetical protein